jgi:transitional endoplasmic reticulum ATPase
VSPNIYNVSAALRLVVFIPRIQRRQQPLFSSTSIRHTLSNCQLIINEMPPLFDDFVHISGPAESAAPRTSLQPNWQPGVPNDFLENTKGARLFTEGLIVDSIRRHHPKYHLTVTPGYTCDLLGFANAQDDVTYFPHGNPTENLVERQFIPPARRYNDEAGGSFNSGVVFGCYDYIFKGKPFLVYIVEGSDGGFGKTRYNYILVEGLPSDLGQEVAQKQTDELIAAASKWALELHDEVLIFDSGMWQKNRELWQNIQKSNWEDVILEKSKKDAIIDDVTGFFNKEKRYQEFGVPWKA